MTRTIIGVLRGGTSSEYDLSLKTGAAILGAIPENEYDVRDIFIDKFGVWHVRGIPAAPMRALQQVDVVISALHGGIGEDGTVTRILEQAMTPYVGSRPAASSLSLNKVRAREVLQKNGIMMPRAVSFSINNELNTADMAEAVFSQFGPPYIVKPISDGASSGVQFTATILNLPDVIGDTLDAFGAVLIEEYIRGTEATVGIVEEFRNEELYALPPAEIILPGGHSFIDFASRQGGDLKHRAPSSFGHDEKDSLAQMARAAHRALGLSHYSRADMILTKRGPYLLEVNALPGLYEGSAMPPMLEAVGSSVGNLTDHLIRLSKKSR